MRRKKILLIYTGGTIGMVKDRTTGANVPGDFTMGKIYDMIPILSRFNADLVLDAFSPLIDSSDMCPEVWIKTVQLIENKYENYDGFIIMHGTDTMSYTASALSFMMENLSKPVILTGSQLPLGAVRTDGRRNLINAVETSIAEDVKGLPMIPEVALCFENKIFRGNRTFKFDAEDFEAFESANYPALADIGIHIKYNSEYILKNEPYRQFKCHKKLDSNVVVFKLFPGLNRKVAEAVLGIPGLKGVVLETYGSGNAMTDKWFLELLSDAVKQGIIIVNVSQCRGGAVEMGLYGASCGLAKAGLISGYDMTTESALTKLMFLLGAGLSIDDIKIKMQANLRGEMSVIKKD